MSPGQVDKHCPEWLNTPMDTPTHPPAPTWTTLREASDKLGVSTRTLRRAVNDGRVLGKREDTPAAPWMIRFEDAAKYWGTMTPPPPAVTDPSETSALAIQLGDMATMLNDAKNSEADARERAARAEAEVDHLRNRLAQYRQQEARRWWQRKEPLND